MMERLDETARCIIGALEQGSQNIDGAQITQAMARSALLVMREEDETMAEKAAMLGLGQGGGQGAGASSGYGMEVGRGL